MAYNSYKLTQNLSSPTPQAQMMYDKSKQVEYLYYSAMDRVDGCLINGIAFTESPRIFDRKIRSDYLQTITVETININDRLNVGDTLQFDGDLWICSTSFVFHNLYSRGTFFRCNYTLLFQSPTDYSILSYPCITSNKSFSNEENNVMVLGDNKKSIWCCFNNDTAKLKVDDRLYVDRKNPPTPYKIIGDTDTTTTEGLIYFMVEQDTAENTTEYPDRPDLGVCNYHEPVVEPEPPVVGYNYAVISISGNLIIGGNTRTVTPTFYNADCTLSTETVTPVWTVILPSGYESDFTVTYISNQIKILVAENYDLIDKNVIVNVQGNNGGYGGTQTFLITAE